MYIDEINKEISAEMYIHILFPEMEKDLVVRDKGLFSRNYSADLLSIDTDQHVVELSREGFLGILPPDLISPEEELNDDNWKRSRQKDIRARDGEIKRRVAILADAFSPLDTYRFRYSLAEEQKIEEILSEKTKLVLKMWYGFDLDNETDPYLRKAAMLLPYIPQFRGDLQFVRSLLHSLTKHDVTLSFSRFGDNDNTVCWITMAHFHVIIDDLTQEQYLEESAKLKKVSEFIKEHFIPVDMLCEIGVKGVSDKCKILDYNTICE